jgi:hypothetical protein
MPSDEAGSDPATVDKDRSDLGAEPCINANKDQQNHD